ncbi:MAG: Lrp/AsnC family transcriptional regulator [Aquihabitans sp.]
MSGPDSTLDAIDRRILAVLLADGRVSINELAAQANVSRATAYSRFDRLKARGIITGFRAEVDQRVLGLEITALVLVNVEQRSWKSSLKDLGALPGVQSVALTSGGFDFALTVRLPDVAHLRDVLLVRLQGLRQVRSTQTIFVLDELHRPLDLALVP